MAEPIPSRVKVSLISVNLVTFDFTTFHKFPFLRVRVGDIHILSGYQSRMAERGSRDEVNAERFAEGSG
jgi:hypothetical protein